MAPSQPLTIGIIAAVSTSPFHAPLLQAITQEIARRNARLVFVQGTPEWMLRTRVAHGLADGWMAIAVTDGAERLAALGKPVLLVSGYDGDLPSVQPDNVSGARAAVEHLIAQGRRRIAFIGTQVNPDFRERLATYRATLVAHGIAPDPALELAPEGYTVVECQDAMARLLASGSLPDAVFGANDWAAIGAMQASQAAGLRVPDDIAVVGFDNMPEAQHTEPPLSSVHQRPDQLGLAALRLLIAQITSGSQPPRVTRVSTQFIARASSSASQPRGDGERAARYRGADWQELLANDLVQRALAPAELAPEEAPAAVWPGVQALIAALAQACAGSAPAALPRSTWAELAALTSSDANLQAVLQLLRAAGYERLRAGAGLDGAPALCELMAECQAGVERVAYAAAAEQTKLQTQATINESSIMRHFTSASMSPAQLGWMAWTWVDWAAIGLLDRDSPPADISQATLTIPSTFDRASGAQACKRRAPVPAFPPLDLIPEALRASPEHILKIAELRTQSRVWGYIAVLERFYLTSFDVIDNRNTYIATMLERDALLHALHEQSIRDSLTGLYNRRFATEQLQLLAAQTRRSGYALSLATLDIDHFKRINDTYLHAGGDRVLVEMATILRRETRSADMVVRIGGEEFVIVMPDTPLAGAVQACERVRAAVEQHPWHTIAAGLQVTISIGVACSTGELSAADLLQASDAQLYAAKAGGRNRVVAASDPA